MEYATVKISNLITHGRIIQKLDLLKLEYFLAILPPLSKTQHSICYKKPNNIMAI